MDFKKEGWLKHYSVVLILNAVYIIVFCLIMNTYS